MNLGYTIGAPELILILVVVLLLFGSTRLPKLARSLGQASKEFKQGVIHGEEEGDAKADKSKAGSPATTEKTDKAGKAAASSDD